MVLISDGGEMGIAVKPGGNSFICCTTSRNCSLPIRVLVYLGFDCL